jgi:hypothetical protein
VQEPLREFPDQFFVVDLRLADAEAAEIGEFGRGEDAPGRFVRVDAVAGRVERGASIANLFVQRDDGSTPSL